MRQNNNIDLITMTQSNSPPSSIELRLILDLLQTSGNRRVGRMSGLTLHSHFQPIFSIAHNRMIGCEGLLRATGDDGQAVAPLEALGREASHILTMDRLASAVHAHNFRALGTDGWLFLNMTTAVFLASVRNDNFLTPMLGATGLPPHRVVIEILEQGVKDELQLGEAVEFFRSQGYLIALDDFGAGHSNFDRVWNLRPDIVKIDRSMVTQAGGNVRIRRMMPVMVSLLHEVGSLVVMEGIETEGEALMAMDADVDFVQGFYFAMPAEALPAEEQCRALFEQLWTDYREVSLPAVAFHQREITPYLNAIGHAASLLESGLPLSHAAQGFLDLPGAERCYLLDEQGRQLGENLINARRVSVADPRYGPLASAQGANWSRRFYFLRALEQPGRVQVTRPYLSIAGANPCITVSIGGKINGEMRVLCGDVGWRDRGPVRN